MESQPQNPEFRINPENFHPCKLTFMTSVLLFSFSGSANNTISGCFTEKYTVITGVWWSGEVTGTGTGILRVAVPDGLVAGFLSWGAEKASVIKDDNSMMYGI